LWTPIKPCNEGRRRSKGKEGVKGGGRRGRLREERGGKEGRKGR
jgi:hypothetical protein